MSNQTQRALLEELIAENAETHEETHLQATLDGWELRRPRRQVMHLAVRDGRELLVQLQIFFSLDVSLEEDAPAQQGSAELNAGSRRVSLDLVTCGTQATLRRLRPAIQTAEILA